MCLNGWYMGFGPYKYMCTTYFKVSTANHLPLACSKLYCFGKGFRPAYAKCWHNPPHLCRLATRSKSILSFDPLWLIFSKNVMASWSNEIIQTAQNFCTKKFLCRQTLGRLQRNILKVSNYFLKNVLTFKNCLSKCVHAKFCLQTIPHKQITIALEEIAV